MRILFKLIGLLEKRQKRVFALFTLLSLLSPAADLYVVSRFIPLIQQVFQPDMPERMTERLVFLALAFLMVGALSLLKNRCSAALTMDISHGWSLKIYALYGEEKLEEHNQKNFAQAIAGLRSDPAVCAGMLISYVDLAILILTATVYSIIMARMAQTVGAISCLFALVFMAGFYMSGHTYVVRYGEKRRQMEIKVNGLITTAFGSYKEIKVDSRREKLQEKYQEACKTCAQVQKNLTFIQGLQSAMLGDLVQAALLLLLAAVLAAGVDLPRVLPEAVIYITLLTRLLPVFQRIAAALTSLQYSRKYFESFQASMDRYDAMRRAQAEKALLREKRVTLNRGIRVENLSFHYPNGRQIFDNVSMDIPAGHSVAIVGPSGEGKTTFLDLVLGLLHPQAGHIWYDDFDIVEGRDDLGPCRADLGNIVSYIPQTVYLNDGTVRGNVAFMVDEDEERLIECLKYAQIWEDVRKMPDGLDTLIGQNGSAISGGQRQRIALARALYKQFEILIMDEATAALDADTESAVLDSIRSTRGGKTLLLVTHHIRLANECEYVYQIADRQLARVK